MLFQMYKWSGSMKIRYLSLLILLPVLLCTGCTGLQDTDSGTWYRVSDSGVLTMQVPDPTVSSSVLDTIADVSIEELTFTTFSGNVSAILIAPDTPSTALVWAPGAGVPALGHREHLMEYAQHGIAVLVVDIRGNGGKTPGYPFSPEVDYQKYHAGEWPQVYLIISDLISAERYLHHRYGSITVWMVGESNGGRYTAIASALDPHVSGYVGISTSGFGRAGDQYEGDARQFLLSIDPEVLASSLAPRRSLLFHAPGDSIIPLESGKTFASIFGPSAEFITFNGTHGVNSEVDQILLSEFGNPGGP